jgi:hypothetical protein
VSDRKNLVPGISKSERYLNNKAEERTHSFVETLYQTVTQIRCKTCEINTRPLYQLLIVEIEVQGLVQKAGFLIHRMSEAGSSSLDFILRQDRYPQVL